MKTTKSKPRDSPVENPSPGMEWAETGEGPGLKPGKARKTGAYKLV